VRIGFVGLGKLGLPVALALDDHGHQVAGWDSSSAVREQIRLRRLRNGEQRAEELIARSRLRLAALAEVVGEAEVVFVAVQTPHEESLGGAQRLPPHRQDFDYGHLVAAVAEIADVLREQDARPVVAVISTVLPGTMEREIEPLLPAGVALAYNPFFTAMGTTIDDFLAPEFVLLGSDGGAARDADRLLRRLYGSLHDRPIFSTDIRTAELIKVAYNTYIGQKIVFANAMMELCERIGADVDELSSALALGEDRIVSARYLRGGMGDGGPCHPRDNIALSWLAEELGLSHDPFDAVMQAREAQTEWLADLVVDRADGLPIVVLGKAFKPETRLVEGSPALLLGEILRERGIDFEHRDHRVDGGSLPSPDDDPRLFFVATRHPEYQQLRFPTGSVVLDPWGCIPDQEGVSVSRIGRRNRDGAGAQRLAVPGEATASR
jgi:UDPglucose 6-dehydrogenase